MKRSLSVSLTILTVIAAAACDEQASQQCVDENEVAVSDDKCADAGPVNNGGNTRSGFFWYYNNRSVPIGSKVYGGTYSHDSVSSGTRGSSVGVSRGGFGSIRSDSAGG